MDLKNRVKTIQRDLDRRQPETHPPNPLEHFGRRYPGSAELLSEIWWRYVYTRRTARLAPTLEAAARADPRVAAAVAEMAELVWRQGSAA